MPLHRSLLRLRGTPPHLPRTASKCPKLDSGGHGYTLAIWHFLPRTEILSSSPTDLGQELRLDAGEKYLYGAGCRARALSQIHIRAFAFTIFGHFSSFRSECSLALEDDQRIWSVTTKPVR
jgi:hypothetical protein